MQIAKLYNLICDLYKIDDRVDVEAFIIPYDFTGNDFVVGNRNSGREAVFIYDKGSEVEMGLFLSPEVINELSIDDPLSNPDSFGCAAEGLSHFIYLMDRLNKGMHATKLELELQAEVDKFLLFHLAAANGGKSVPESVFNMQFEDFSFDSNLTPDEKERYIEASAFAAKFCHFLRQNYFNPLRISELMVVVREFFKMNLSQKIARLTP